ncbi:MAG: M6 family metalloprotease domain-containing protein [Gemmatimonadota bacterium]
MSRVAFRAGCAAAIACGILTAESALAQDVVNAGKVNGVEIPTSYYAQVREQPGLYEFERALFNRVGPDRTSAFGEVGLPVVLALFSDSPANPHVTSEDVKRSLFDGPSPYGTMTESYLEMSRGALTVRGDVYGWVRTSLTMNQVVGTDRSFGPDNRVGEYLVEALSEIDPTVDFAQYDNDGPDGIANSGDDDGYVDVVTFEYLEVSASCGGPSIWPHRSTLQGRSGAPFKTDDVGVNGDTILIQDYITQGATDCSGENVQDAGVITHEFGHALGFPDWYHWIDPSLGPSGRRWVLGCWALMAAGSWGCGPVGSTREPFGPTHMIGFSKEWLGWIDYTDVGEVWNETFELSPAQTDGEVLRIQLDEAGDEFLLAEYRGLVGFDDELPAAGVLLYKLDENASIRPPPESDDPYFLTMLERDADSSLRLMATEGGSRGEPGDAWGVNGESSSLTGDGSPSLRLANGSWSSVQVHEAYVEGDVARLVLSTGKTPRLIEPAAVVEVDRVRTFFQGVRIAGGYGPYTPAADLPEGFSLIVEGDELVLVGSVQDAEPREYELAITDSRGSTSETVTVRVTGTGEWVVDSDRLFQLFLQTNDRLSPGELSYLDEIGNDNGQYDVGDLRRWLREGDPNGSG